VGYKKTRLYVPEGKLRDTFLKECHDGPLAGHGGAKRTTTFLKKSYYWPNLKDSAEEYVKTCLTCQQNRTFNKKQAGLLQPLPILEGPWESVSMDFMVSFPHQGDLMPSWWWWIDLARWHISFPQRMKPQPKR
jgi:hypothetical protein